MSLTTKTPEHVVPAYNLPRGRADQGKVAEAARETAEAEAPHAAQAARAAEGRMVRRQSDSVYLAIMSLRERTRPYCAQ